MCPSLFYTQNYENKLFRNKIENNHCLFQYFTTKLKTEIKRSMTNYLMQLFKA